MDTSAHPIQSGSWYCWTTFYKVVILSFWINSTSEPRFSSLSLVVASHLATWLLSLWRLISLWGPWRTGSQNKSYASLANRPAASCCPALLLASICCCYAVGLLSESILYKLLTLNKVNIADSLSSKHKVIFRPIKLSKQYILILDCICRVPILNFPQTLKVVISGHWRWWFPNTDCDFLGSCRSQKSYFPFCEIWMWKNGVWASVLVWFGLKLVE